MLESGQSSKEMWALTLNPGISPHLMYESYVCQVGVGLEIGIARRDSLEVFVVEGLFCRDALCRVIVEQLGDNDHEGE